MSEKLKKNTSGRNDSSKAHFGKNIWPHIEASYRNEEEDEEKKRQVKSTVRSFSAPLPAPRDHLEEARKVANKRLQGQGMNIGRISGFDKK